MFSSDNTTKLSCFKTANNGSTPVPYSNQADDHAVLRVLGDGLADDVVAVRVAAASAMATLPRQLSLRPLLSRMGNATDRVRAAASEGLRQVLSVNELGTRFSVFHSYCEYPHCPRRRNSRCFVFTPPRHSFKSLDCYQCDCAF
jgi:hypothetical protein